MELRGNEKEATSEQHIIMLKYGWDITGGRKLHLQAEKQEWKMRWKFHESLNFKASIS